MASFLDAMAFLRTTGLFQVVLPGILIIALIYAILSRYEVFGKEKISLNMIVAFVLGFIFMSFSKAALLVNYMIPMFVGVFISIFLIMLLKPAWRIKPNPLTKLS